MASTAASPLAETRPLFNLAITNLGEFRSEERGEKFSYSLGTVVLQTSSDSDRVKLSALLRSKLSLGLCEVSEAGSSLQLKAVRPVDFNIFHFDHVYALTVLLFDALRIWQKDGIFDMPIEKYVARARCFRWSHVPIDTRCEAAFIEAIKYDNILKEKQREVEEYNKTHRDPWHAYLGKEKDDVREAQETLIAIEQEMIKNKGEGALYRWRELKKS